MDGLFKPPIFSMGIHSVPTYMDYLYSWIGQVTKIVLGERKWKPVVKKFCAGPRWFLELHTHSYRSICRRIYRIKYSFLSSLETYFLHGRKPRNTLKETPNLTTTGWGYLRQISDTWRSDTGAKTSYLICIWTLQGSLVNLSIYIFEFVGCSEK